MDKLDELYGECRNPTKKLNKQQYKACLAKERANGESFFNLEGDLNDLIRGKKETIVYQNSINPYLWKASLEVTKKYPLKIADNQGGYIETNWINDDKQRCLIKIRILSSELISTGVTTNFICENISDNKWINDGKNYINEEKQLTLSILKTAANLKSSNL